MRRFGTLRFANGTRFIRNELETKIETTADPSLPRKGSLPDRGLMRLPAHSTASHVLRSSKVPSVALYLVECTFQRGFDSFRAHHSKRSFDRRFGRPCAS